MRGDFSRLTFNPRKRYTRVWMQQGRVLLDADWNEQADIQAYYLRALVVDLIGAYGGPRDNCGFAISVHDGEKRSGQSKPGAGDFFIGRGRYYVGGLLCENERSCLFSAQPNASPALLTAGSYLVYLDVWERQITFLEEPAMREVALGGPDTTTRSQLVWLVKALPLDIDRPYFPSFLATLYWRSWLKQSWRLWLEKLQPANRGQLKVTCDEVMEAVRPAGTGGYRGLENHFYRVEIHTGSQGGKGAAPTFKCSRDNGSLAAAILHITADERASTTIIELDPNRCGARFDLRQGNWVEVVEVHSASQAASGPLYKVLSFDPESMRATVAGLHHSETGRAHSQRLLLRRWDQSEAGVAEGYVELVAGAVRLAEKNSENENWIPLEEGIFIQFQPGGFYRAGDYWQFAARSGAQAVEWPTEQDELGRVAPEALPPSGSQRHFAPLAVVSMDRNGKLRITDLRRTFKPV